MDVDDKSVWARLGVQLDLAEHDPHPPAEDPLAVCAGAGPGHRLHEGQMCIA